MRTRKAVRKFPPLIFLDENEILEACELYLKQKGYNLGNKMYFKIRFPKKDKLGRQRRSKVETAFELKGEENVERKIPEKRKEKT